MENSYFEVTGAGHTSAATIAGRLNGGKIQNCYSSAILINSAVEVDQKSPADVSVGGIVGMVNGNNSLISNCSFAGTVNATVGIAGGIVGKINYGISGTQIQQCTNTGSVTGDRKGDIYGVNQGSGTSVTN